MQSAVLPSHVVCLSVCPSVTSMSANRHSLNMDKTELIWCGSKHSLSKFGRCAPTIRLGADIIAASEHVRLLGVTLSSDLSLEKHVSTVSATCFGHLRQIRRIQKSLDAGSTATLVHAFVTSRVDYCNVVLAVTAIHHRQAATSYECCCPCHQQHTEVRQRLVSSAA